MNFECVASSRGVPFAYLDFRRNNLLFTFRLVVVSLPPFVIPFGVSFNLALFVIALFELCTANNFSSRFECFFVPVKFCRKHNITLRVIAQCTQKRIGRCIGRLQLQHYRRRSISYLFRLSHTILYLKKNAFHRSAAHRFNTFSVCGLHLLTFEGD